MRLTWCTRSDHLVHGLNIASWSMSWNAPRRQVATGAAPPSALCVVAHEELLAEGNLLAGGLDAVLGYFRAPDPRVPGQRSAARRDGAGRGRAGVNVVFLFDVDNTLIDNDRVQAHLKEHLEQTYGAATRDRYWELLEELRNELG
jgi:hypothetical protein